MTFSSQDEAWIVYDGECPYCRNYVRLVRLRDALGTVRLIDARKGGPEVEHVRAAGLDLDEGMIFRYGGRLYHGADAIHMMAVLAGPSGLFNRINARVFRSPARAAFLYPILRAGRNTTLFLLGKRKISGGRA